MSKRVEMWRDDSGKLHETKEAADKADAGVSDEMALQIAKLIHDKQDDKAMPFSSLNERIKERYVMLAKAMLANLPPWLKIVEPE